MEYGPSTEVSVSDLPSALTWEYSSEQEELDEKLREIRNGLKWLIVELISTKDADGIGENSHTDFHGQYRKRVEKVAEDILCGR